MIRADSTGMASAVSRPMLFDARRGLYYPKPVLRGWLHLLWFGASLVTGTLLLAHAHGARQIMAVAIFAASVTGLFGISALYHRGNWGALASRWLQRLDHVMIFLLIAGTGNCRVLACCSQTLCCGRPECAVRADPGRDRDASGVDERAGEARRRRYSSGWAGPLAWPRRRSGSTPASAPSVLLLAGGVLYTVGAVTYYRRSPDPFPAVFGFHEVFHAYVCAAAACQYVGISLLIH